ncbi:MAG: hypothetical protein CVV02_07185 [Firmicutes bacterium HGW-Firmicutes-7]|nr:MAG: hypothetical protein CVV02_07185 [Firmicutes bacterium HGW-Firmicutes-7]
MLLSANTQIDVKINNQKLIIEYLLSKGPASRADIAKALNTSKPTISKNVDELIRQNIIVELGKADNQLGKKGTFIDINKEYGYILSIDLSKNSMRLSVNNLTGETKGFQKYSYNIDIEDEHILRSIMDLSKVSKDLILKIIIAYPGVVGHNGQYYLSNLKQKEVKMKGFLDYIKCQFNCEIIVKNDINLALIAEKAYNHQIIKGNLYYISFETGVGSGIMINGQLYEGDRNAAGEVGFIIPSQIKTTTTYKTLEELVSINAILERYKSLTDDEISIETFKKKLLKKEEIAQRLYHEIVETISIAISNVTAILDIENVIIAGAVLNINPSMAMDIQALVNQTSPLKAEIIKSELEQPALKGCIYLGTQEVIKSLIK